MTRRASTKERTDGAATSDVAKALSHPLRLHILQKLNEGVASPKALSDALGEPLALVSYHVKILAQLNCIELVKTVPRRGAIEHFYRPLRRAELSSAEWAELPESARGSLSGLVLTAFMDDASGAMGSGTFDRLHDRHLSLTHLELDEAGWSEVNEALDRLVDQALALQARAMAGDEERVRTVLGLAHFERAPQAPAPAKAPKRAAARRGS
jgi:DNA-binding transcriptional ArsR family regulator